MRSAPTVDEWAILVLIFFVMALIIGEVVIRIARFFNTTEAEDMQQIDSTIDEKAAASDARFNKDRVNAIEIYTRLAEQSRSGVYVLKLLGAASRAAVGAGVLDASTEQRLLAEAMAQSPTPTDEVIAALADALREAVEQQTQGEQSPEQTTAALLRNVAQAAELSDHIGEGSIDVIVDTFKAAGRTEADFTRASEPYADDPTGFALFARHIADEIESGAFALAGPTDTVPPITVVPKQLRIAGRLRQIATALAALGEDQSQGGELVDEATDLENGAVILGLLDAGRANYQAEAYETQSAGSAKGYTSFLNWLADEIESNVAVGVAQVA